MKPIRKLLSKANSPFLERMALLICGYDPVFLSSHPVEYWYNRNTKFPLPKKDVMPLSVRERILAIRLMDKVKANPAAAEKFGLAVVNSPGDLSNAGSESEKAESMNVGR